MLPASRYSLRSLLRGALHVTVSIAVTVGFFAPSSQLWASLGIQPLSDVDRSGMTMSPYLPARVPGWVVPLAIGAVAGFFHSWFHRARHTWPVLWRFHAVHHSIPNMSAPNCNHHWAVQIFFVPGLLGLFEHSSTRLNFGPFRHVLPDDRIHHSIVQADWGHDATAGTATTV